MAPALAVALLAGCAASTPRRGGEPSAQDTGATSEPAGGSSAHVLPPPSGAGPAPVRQDPHLTPGSMVPGLDAARVCAPGFAPSEDAPEPVRAGVFALYGIAYPAMAGSYHVDHLIPAALGGDDSIRNLWPQPDEGGAGYPSKARLATALHDLVCSGRLPLAAAQQAIVRDWYAAAQQYGVAVAATASAAPGPPPAPVQVSVEPDPPTPSASTRSRPVVRLGGTCQTPGAHSQTATGGAVTCRRSPPDPAYRWHTG